jgi:hypothetical protein
VRGFKIADHLLLNGGGGLDAGMKVIPSCARLALGEEIDLDVAEVEA